MRETIGRLRLDLKDATNSTRLYLCRTSGSRRKSSNDYDQLVWRIQSVERERRMTNALHGMTVDVRI